MPRIYNLEVENCPENIALVRLNSSFIASRINFNVEDIEDIKVSVSEAMNYQLNLSKKTSVQFELEDKSLKISVINDNLKTKKEDSEDSDKFAKMILESLMDEVVFEDNAIHLSKYLKDN